MSGGERERCTFFEALEVDRLGAGSAGNRWELTTLPRSLGWTIGRLDRTLHGIEGVATILRAGAATQFAAQAEGEKAASEALGDNLTDKLFAALGELLDHANDGIESIATMYPEQRDPAVSIAARIADVRE